MQVVQMFIKLKTMSCAYPVVALKETCNLWLIVADCKMGKSEDRNINSDEVMGDMSFTAFRFYLNLINPILTQI